MWDQNKAWQPIEGTDEYYDSKQRQEQFDTQQKIDKQQLEIQKQQLEVQKQQQATDSFIVVAGIILASILVLSIVTFLIYKIIKHK